MRYVYLKQFLHYKAFVIPVIFFIVMAEIASFNAPVLFSRLEHTFSVLGAQSFDRAWLMNTGWIGFGVLVIVIATGYHHKEDLPLAITYPIIAFAISVILIGIWRSDQVLLEALTDVEEANDHLIFYTIACGSVTFGILLHALMSASKTLKIVHVLFAVLMVILMLLLRFTTNYQGLWDRLMWLIIFVWLISMYGRMHAYGDVRRF